MYCKKCGNQLPQGALYCPYCGEKNDDGYFAEPTEIKDYEPSSNNDVYNYSTEQPASSGDTGRFAWAVLGFFFPVVGLILYFVMRRNKPRTAKKTLIGAIVGFAVETVSFIVYIIAAVIGGIFGADYSGYFDLIGRILDMFKL